MEIQQLQQIQQGRNIGRIQRPDLPGTAQPTKTSDGKSFQELLNERIAGQEETVKFSSHAQQRIQQRKIPFGPDDLNLLSDAITKAAEKGSKESLVLMDSKAFVVSVPNRTVITAVDRAQMQDNVFTNIDSTVLL
ncbi:MAG: hypothetical protein K9N46_07185 [Candidatus Marinimicrobia bacterium]|nr:hypothetical protein [Candidatus Neomarinimicrobiota bacterium]MCF7880505.1 hypothetical protein [Candidatus Neomarinimicrobiota bacterium]